jgi:ABC-type multidrug transport system fused ATPase/permease subunit
MYSRYLEKSYSFFLKNNSSYLIRNINGEVEGLRDTIVQFSILITESLIVIFIVLVLIFYNPIPTILFITIVLILSIFFNKLSRNYISSLGSQRSENFALSLKNLTQGLLSIKEIILYDRSKYFFQLYKNTYSDYSNTNRKYTTLISLPRLLIEVLAVLGIIIIVFFVFKNNKNEESLITTLALYAYASFRVMPSISKIYNATQHILFCQNSVNIVYDQLKTSASSTILHRKIENINFHEKIELRNIIFKHPNSIKPLFDDFSFFIPKLSKIAIVGESGSGKSTIVDIILGLLHITSGGIYIDNTLLDDSNLKSWQMKFGYVPQRITLLDDTIRRNIAYGINDNEIDDIKLIEAAKKANLLSFIRTLPNGFDTNVAERGTNLSGGQGQRIILARALYNNPEILILDESTSALDVKTEKSILQNVYSLKNVTVIMITHRLSTIMECDYYIQLSEGKIVKQGKPISFDVS